MNRFDEILNQAITELQQGRTLSEVLNIFPEHKKDLEEPLAAISPLIALPKKAVPEPARQRKYLLAPQPKIWLAWLHVSRFAAISAGIMLLFSTLTAGAYATFSSMPGSPLFGLKKSAEQLQLTLAGNNQAKVADLQIQIAQKRLAEAREILASQDNPEKEKAAITELLAQTKTAIEATNKLAAKNPQPAQNQSVVNTLETIARQQQTLLTEINPQNDINAETKIALQQTRENLGQVEDIKKYIATASKETDMADLKNQPGEVKDASTTAASAIKPAEEASSTAVSAGKKTSSTSTSTPPGPETDPNTAVGTFIPEDPSPVYSN